MLRLTSALALLGLLSAIVGCDSSSGPQRSAGPSGATSSSVSPVGRATPADVPTNMATPASTTGASIDSCSLLSDGEIAAATGGHVISRQSSTLTRVFPSVCDVELDNTGSLTVSVLPSGGRSLYEESFEPFIGEDSGPLDEAVPGLGDKAAKSGDDELMVLNDDTLFDLLYIEFGRNDKLPLVTYLAQTVLAKLPCVATGCAGFTPLPVSSSATAATDVCSVLTSDEIKQATGFAATDPTPAGAVGHDQSCTWTLNTDSSIAGLDWLEVEVKETGGKSNFDLYATSYDPPLEHIPGLADDAIKTATIPSGAFYVLKGDELITVSFSMPLSVDDPYALVQPLLPRVVATIAGSGQ